MSQEHQEQLASRAQSEAEKKREYGLAQARAYLDIIWAPVWRRLGALIASGGITTQDVARMLRANMLGFRHDPVCQGPRSTEKAPYRAVMQGRLPEAPAPVPFPRNTLMCPLHERYLLGDQGVPCSWFIPPRGDMPAADAPKRQMVPCEMLSSLIRIDLKKILGQGGDPSARPGEDELLRRRARLLQAGPDPGGPEHLHDQIRFLLDSGRLTVGELANLGNRDLLVTDPEWLPCQDDPYRRFYHDLASERDDESEQIDDTRIHCWFHVRARMGDRTVPCAQALEAPADLHERYEETREITELPRSWDGEEDQPGGPRDPVRVLGIRPCHAVGRLLLHELPRYLQRLAQDAEGYDVDVRSLKRRQETSDPEDVLAALDAPAS